jgi:predicted metal-dependent enzyme (double-stranded beta helix superfamily)
MTEPLDLLIQDLVALADECANPARVVPLLAPLANSGVERGIGVAPRFATYTRNLLYRDDRFELVVIRWGAEAQSRIHDHAGQRCQMLVLDGMLRTDDYALLDGGTDVGAARIRFTQSTSTLRGEVDVRTADRDLHLVATDEAGAASLHLYTKPIDTCLVFDPVANTCSRFRNHYDWTARGFASLNADTTVHDD